MIKKFTFFLLLFSVLAFSSLFDFKYTSEFKDSYSQKDYKSALKSLKSLNQDSAIVEYNMGNIYYKMGRYKEALISYKRASGKGVDEAYRVYNIGNCYLKLKEYDKAIYAYKIALEHKDMKDARYNKYLAQEEKFRAKIDKKSKKKKKKKKKEKAKDGKSKKKSKKKKKLSKKELRELTKLKEKMEFKKRLKNRLKENLKDKKVPVLLYKIDTKVKSNKEIKPW